MERRLIDANALEYHMAERTARMTLTPADIRTQSMTSKMPPPSMLWKWSGVKNACILAADVVENGFATAINGLI